MHKVTLFMFLMELKVKRYLSDNMKNLINRILLVLKIDESFQFLFFLK